ncbi:MAG TPA: TolC family protein [Bryobacteraceae bacterium]|nr:TolC family protein [Bryobacteraceae bacterium]
MFTRYLFVGSICASTMFAQVSAVQNPVPGSTSSVNTLSPSVQVQGAYAGSVADAQPVPGVLKLSMRDAIRRGLRTNLSGAQLSAVLHEATAQASISRSALLPNVSANLREVLTKTNLRAFGVRFPGAPTVVGPFNYFDLRATLSQTLFDPASLAAWRASRQNIVASEHRLADAKDVVVLAASGAYLQAVAAQARIQAAGAQVATAQTLYDQSAQQQKEGVLAVIDVNRSRVQLQTQQQSLITLQNDFARQKLNLARIIGLAPGQEFELADAMPAEAPVSMAMRDILSLSYRQRSDLQAAETAVRAAELRRTSARAQRIPSLALNADYGAIGTNPAQAAGTYTVTGNLRIPIWAGGRVGAEIVQAEAQLEQRRAELADMRGRIDAEVRSALLDLESATSQVQVARENLAVARQSMDLTRQRFDAGIADTAEVSRALETVAAADQDVITSQFAHNLAKAVLARAMGRTEENLAKLLPLP